MWAFALIPVVAVIGLAFRYRTPAPPDHGSSSCSSSYAPLSTCDDDIELAVCDVVEWLVDARDRLGLVGRPSVVRVDMGTGQAATRVVFEIKQGERELWLDGPEWMRPLPRVRALDWDATDAGVPFDRNANGLERAVLETIAPRRATAGS